MGIKAGANSSKSTTTARRSRRLIVWVILALFLIGVFAVTCILMQPNWFQRLKVRLFGPPQVELQEKYSEQGTATFDHSKFDQLLKEHVKPGGWVDYQAIREQPETLNRYLEQIAGAPIEKLGRDDRLALLINAYNAFTIQLILDHYPVESIKDIPADQRWKEARWELSGETLSLNQIEHERIRPNFIEPRIHFALVCAAIGCPPLRREAYVGDRLEEQLADQTDYVHSRSTWFQFDAGTNRLSLTPLYSWYRNDFVQVEGGIIPFIDAHTSAIPASAPREKLTIDWLDYDWTLNDVQYQDER